MTNDAVLDAVLALSLAAVRDGLLSDVDALCAGIERTGWVCGVHGGQWHLPTDSSWSLFSSDHAPDLGVFFSDEDPQVVFARGQELARRLDREVGLERHGSGPGRPEWARDDPRGAAWTGLEADWVTWDGGPSRISLNVRPALQPGRVREPPSLHLQIERLDTPSDGLPADEERARSVAATGSALARWHLASEMELPDDVVRALEEDEDPAVVAAVGASERFRRWRREAGGIRPEQRAD